MAPTISFPLDEPHLKALRWACEYMIVSPEEAAAWRPVDESRFPQAHALDAISYPASAASLVRDLLARAGVTLKHICVIKTITPPYVSIDDGVFDNMVSSYEIPALIRALCDLAPGDRDGAMRALREVGRRATNGKSPSMPCWNCCQSRVNARNASHAMGILPMPVQ